MADQAMTSMSNYGSDQVVRATLETFFGISPDMTVSPPTVLAADQTMFDYVFGMNTLFRSICYRLLCDYLINVVNRYICQDRVLRT